MRMFLSLVLSRRNYHNFLNVRERLMQCSQVTLSVILIKTYVFDQAVNLNGQLNDHGIKRSSKAFRDLSIFIVSYLGCTLPVWEIEQWSRLKHSNLGQFLKTTTDELSEFMRLWKVLLSEVVMIASGELQPSPTALGEEEY